MILFSGNANRKLAQEICEYLGTPLGLAEVTQFSDGETFVQVSENVRGADVFVIQPTCPPVDHHLMELLIMMDALRRASAARITAVIPYYGYSRQDRKVQPRVPISQIQGFFNIPVDHLFALPVLLQHFQEMDWNDGVVVAPDAGGVERARAFAKRLDTSLAFIDKRREGPNDAKVMHIVGDVKDRNVIIVDDMVDTAGTIVQAVTALREQGAQRIYASCTHPVLSGQAIERIESSTLEEVVVTNTIPLDERRSSKKLTILSVAPLLGEAIDRIHRETSVSSLFV
jgi:ribose-phosphate pyrophosphokinase